LKAGNNLQDENHCGASTFSHAGIISPPDASWSPIEGSSQQQQQQQKFTKGRRQKHSEEVSL